MSIPNTSLVPVSVENAAIAAHEMMERYNTIRVQEYDVALGRALDETVFTWKWPFRRKLTSNEAFHLVNSVPDTLGADYSFCRWRDAGSQWKEMSERLRAAVELSATEQVWLDLDTARRVLAFIPEQKLP